MNAMTSQALLFVGSVNRPSFLGPGTGRGLSVFLFDEETGQAALRSTFQGIDNPTYIAVDARRALLFAVSEVYGWNEGTVSAFRFDRRDGRLTYLNKQPTLGSITNQVSFCPSTDHVFIANYAHNPGWGGYYGEDVPGHAAAVFPVGADGRLGPASSSVSHHGSGPDPLRQRRTHPHCAMASPDGRFVLVADLGIDQIISYRFDAGRLERSSTFAMPPGSGPRHFKFADNGRIVYAINELSSTVTQLAYDAEGGQLSLLQVISTLPDDLTAWNNCSELQIAPDGRFLYAANRGHDSIAVFGIDPETGALTAIDRTPSGGAIPRNIGLSPSGSHLLAANQNSDNVTIFRRDPGTGTLTPSGTIETGMPMVVAMVPVLNEALT